MAQPILLHGPLAQKAVVRLADPQNRITLMTDLEYKTLVEKIEREFPVRLQLAELAGRPKINVKNYKQLEVFDDTIADLFLEISLNKPANMGLALAIIQPLYEVQK